MLLFGICQCFPSPFANLIGIGERGYVDIHEQHQFVFHVVTRKIIMLVIDELFFILEDLHKSYIFIGS